MLVHIQVLRFFAAAAVVAFHALGVATNGFKVPESAISFALSYAGRGVDLFFVISGFIIFYATDRAGLTPAEFLRRRVERIVPLYFVAIFAVTVLAMTLPATFGTPGWYTPRHILKSLAFIAFTGGEMPVVYVGWSLEYEMYFYLAVALLMALTRDAWRNKTISDATDLPLIVFQYPLATGQGYPAATLERLFDEVPTIRAIKDWTPLVPQHESQIRALQGRDRPINVLSTNSAWLLSSLVLGCNGLLSGSGSVIADLQARLYRAVKLNDLAEARRLNDRIYPTARVFYADPFIDMHNRMKEALVLLGKLPRAVVRPPLVKITDAEIVRIRDALMEAELLGTRTALGRNAA